MISPMTTLPVGVIFCVASILLGTFGRTSSWVISGYSQLPITVTTRRLSPFLISIQSRSDSVSEDESDCPDEDECEIDWGAMPGFGDDDAKKDVPTTDVVSQDNSDPDCPEEDECEIDWSAMPGFGDDDDEDDAKKESDPEATAAATTTSSDLLHENRHLIGDETDELEPQDAYVRKVERSVGTSRKILEMNWQIENCEVDEDTCTDFCSDCSGSGKTSCKFCHGTRMISFFHPGTNTHEHRSCLLCADGRVDCPTCAGTGAISPWAKTHDGTL